jgi:hypothetical protein
MIGFGCVHPPGENDEYDGLYYRKNEMHTLANDLEGKPVCIEHRDEHAGTVKHAWVGENNECFAIFETNTEYPGLLAKNLIKHDVCTDLSLGHRVTIDREENCVIDKNAMEISICEKGARPNTHIYGFHKNEPASKETKNKSYILEMKSSSSNMSEVDPAPISPEATQTADSNQVQETTHAEKNDSAKPTDGAGSTASNPMIKEFDNMMKKMKDQATELMALQDRFKQSEEARLTAETEIKGVREQKKRKREKVIEGTIKDFVGQMVSKWKNELNPHAGDLEKLLSSMKENESAEPMLALLSCAASTYGKNTTELEKQYQEHKRLKMSLEQTKGELSKMKQPAFVSPTERFVDTAKTAAPRVRVSQHLPSGIQLPRQSLAGMQTTNPDMWSRMTTGSNAGHGMGWFSESNLVGKEYKEGRRPKAFQNLSA